MPAYRPLIFRNPRLIPAILFSAGVGVAGYYGLQWKNLPRFGEQDIEQSTELNLALDLGRLPPEHRPQGQALQELKNRVRAEVENDIAVERTRTQERFAAGVVAMVFGFGQLVFVTLSERSRRTK